MKINRKDTPTRSQCFREREILYALAGKSAPNTKWSPRHDSLGDIHHFALG